MWDNKRQGSIRDGQGKPLKDHKHGISFCNDARPADPIDLLGHGTQVAGIVGAHGNNGIQVAGVAWRVELMTIKVLCNLVDGVPTGTIADAIAGIDYAIQQDATILNLSWDLRVRDSNLEDVLKSAPTKLFVASAGNEKGDNDKDSERVYPAGFNLPNLIAVAATTQSDTLAPFSNHGEKTVHLAAPGANVLTTTLAKALKRVEGTSFAAPHVTGCAALLHTIVGPGKLPDLITRLLEKADQISGLKVNKGRRLNCGRSLH
jgi:subtilisin family serine protease